MAHAGDLDKSFSGNGKRAISFGGTDAAQAVLVQPNGRIVIAGGGGAAMRFCAARLGAAGKLDTTFGPAGKRKIDFGGTLDQGVFGAARQPDGKLVLVGDSDLRVAVARLNTNGTLDSSFSGDGKMIFSWGAISRATAVVVMPSGKLLLGGFSGPEGGDMQVARLNANGTLDTGFGTGGKVAIDFGGTEFGQALARQANGRILIAGRSDIAGAIVARLRTNGALDPDFGTGGRVTLPSGGIARSVMVQTDRKILVAGGSNDAMFVTRLNPSGSLDPGYGVNGTATIDFAPLDDQAGGAVLQADGKVVIAGSVQDGGDFGVARLNPDGSLDAGFGSGGKALVDFGVAVFAFAVALQPNGRIVVAGQRSGSDDFAVARLIG
ncbi:MAG TPA: hypothetical protein VH817_13355 [Thermoleophilaceae bacterium]